MAEPIDMLLGLWSRMGPSMYLLDGCTLVNTTHNLVNMTEPSVCGDVDPCQVIIITLFTINMLMELHVEADSDTHVDYC